MSKEVTLEIFKNLISSMIDAHTLPKLDNEEITELAEQAEENLVPYIVEIFNY